jgi:tRNA G18 (ribose-2'-O)-methylase SpoU
MNTDRPIGVGPHAKPWPTDSKFDPELLAHGDRRNVLDKYRYWTVEAITADLGRDRQSLHIAIENWQHDSNIGTIVRTANAFNIECVHVIGRRHWNRRGAMVTDRYMDIIHHETVDDFVKHMSGKTIIVIDTIDGATDLGKTDLPKNCVLVFGGEGPGVSKEMIDASKQVIAIEQFGSTRSMNVGVAAGIAMYQWMRQHVIID